MSVLCNFVPRFFFYQDPSSYGPDPSSYHYSSSRVMDYPGSSADPPRVPPFSDEVDSNGVDSGQGSSLGNAIHWNLNVVIILVAALTVNNFLNISEKKHF